MLMDVKFTSAPGAGVARGAVSAGLEPAEPHLSFTALIDDAVRNHGVADGVGEASRADDLLDWSGLAELWSNRSMGRDGGTGQIPCATADPDALECTGDAASKAGDDEGGNEVVHAAGILNIGWILAQPLPRTLEDGGDRTTRAGVQLPPSELQPQILFESTAVIRMRGTSDGFGATTVVGPATPAMDAVVPSTPAQAGSVDTPLAAAQTGQLQERALPQPGYLAGEQQIGADGGATAIASPDRPLLSVQPHQVSQDPATAAPVMSSEIADTRRRETRERQEQVDRGTSRARLAAMLTESRMQAEDGPGPELAGRAEALAAYRVAEPSMFSSNVENGPRASTGRHDAPALPAPAGVAATAPDLRGTAAVVTDALAASGQSELPEAETSEQLVQAMRYQLRNGIGDAVVRLKPEHLGAVSVSIRVEHGVVSATVQAEMPAVREWLEAQESSLRNALGEQGLHLDRLVVQRDAERRQRDAQEEWHRRRQQPKRRQPASVAQTFEITV